MAAYIDIDDVWVSAGDALARFTVRLTERAATDISVAWATDADTASASFDYVSSIGTLVIPAGVLEATITVPLRPDGTSAEALESFKVVLSNPFGGFLGRAIGTAVIVDDDTASGSPLISVEDVVVGEDGHAFAVVRLHAASTGTVSVDYATVARTAAPGSDFVPTSGTLVFQPGEMVKTVPVEILDNGVPENRETLYFQLSNPTGGTLAQSRATIAILDDDAPRAASPLVQVDDVTVGAGEAYARFVVRLSEPSTSAVSVTWATDAISASASFDYVSSVGVLTFGPGEIAKTVLVPLRVDGDTAEGLEVFRLVLSSPVGATLGRNAANAVIVDDEVTTPTPTVLVGSTTVDEASETVAVTVRLDSASTSPVAVSFTTANGTAAAGADFIAESGLINFAPGETVKTIHVGIVRNGGPEPTETFHVDLSNPVGAALGQARGTVTILDDDAQRSSSPRLSVDDVWVGEGEDLVRLTVSLSQPATAPVTVNWATDADTASASFDYHSSSGTLTFASGEVAKTILVPLRGGTTLETPESFQVVLSGATGATLGRGAATVVIIDDDAPAQLVPTFTVVPGTVTRTSEGTDWIDIPVMLSAPALGVHRVAYATRAATASPGSDFLPVSGILAFAPGEVTRTIRIHLPDDLVFEAPESFFLDFRVPPGAGLSPAGLPLSAQIALTDNEVPILGTPSAESLTGTDLADRMLGFGGNDRLFGFAGNDTLDGGAGNDVLVGGPGADRMIGDIGNDTFFFDHPADVMIELAGQGVDTVVSNFNTTLAANFENATLAGNAVVANGNAANNLLIGNALANVLRGGLGNDVLDGRGGADTLIGGPGNDTYVVDSALDRIVEGADPGIDTVRSTVSFALAATLEHLTLTGTALRGLGNAGDNRLVGNAVANALVGGAGNDTLSGGGGADQLTGGTGNDTYVIDNAFDRVFEAPGGGIDMVRTSITHALGANIENATALGAGAVRLVGNALDNLLIGSNGANILSGGLGSDSMHGGLGNDTYVVERPTDRILERAGQGTDQVLSNVTHKLGNNVENLSLTGTAAIVGVGNGLGNVLRGNTGANALSGGAGDDRLIGGLGNDRLNGGLGRDLLVGGPGADTFSFTSVADSSATAFRDTIDDFTRGLDRINLSSIDANLLLNGNQAFTFLGAGLFRGLPGDLRFAGGVVQADINGDRVADLHIVVDGIAALTASDFFL